MSQQHNSYVELPRIKRKSNSWEGKVIDYLLKHPSNRPATEFAIEAITAFWLAEALEGQVNQPELQKACWSAIERLEAKLATIRRIARIEPQSIVVSGGANAATTVTSNSQPQSGADAVTTVASTSQPQRTDDDGDSDDEDFDEDFDEDDLGLMKLEPTKELKIAMDLLGYG
ncbi:hypothetical protein [Nostoc parmelioides]|uniref:Uncharacterized protein n=1 Tax=Nostoc parmelioides FACHB-3921 TaxID=2692909 RepID=A0ABR8BNA0_9NOSO|nr:hypothetical protein [Nostoc parmelioides]MBD2254774.1 hypothetical protein [Nostoc parmelioides FACHB-3921]